MTILQDFIWLPPDFVAKTLQFYGGGGGAQRASFLSYPRRLYSAPPEALNLSALSGSEAEPQAPLSIFNEPLDRSPAAMGCAQKFSANIFPPTSRASELMFGARRAAGAAGVGRSAGGRR